MEDGPRAQQYNDAMEFGATQYRDVLDLLTTMGLEAEFTQTGGMNAAIEVRYNPHTELLISDEEESLSWYRDDHVGWRVDVYPILEEGAEFADFSASTSGSALTDLLPVLERALAFLEQRSDN